MFGKGKLLRDGAETQGVVIDSDLASEGASVYRVKVRVKFDDDVTTEISQKLHVSAGLHSAGAVLPVRYDRGNRSKIEIDEPALKAREKAKVAGLEDWKESAIAQAESELARSAAASAQAAPMPATDISGADAELAELLDIEAAESHAGSDPAAASPSGSKAWLDRLAQLAALRDRGVLTDKEFAAEKAKLLDGN